MLGRVLWFDDNKGYGFIESGEIDKDIFFHWTQIKTKDVFKTLIYGQLVKFDLVKDEDEGRFEASNISPEPFINNKTGKPLILVAFMILTEEDTIQKFQIEIGSKEKKGIRFIKSNSEYVIGSSKLLNEEEFHKIIYFLNSDRKVVDTQGELDYDLLIV